MNPMRQLSPAGQQAVDDISRRHGFSSDAVRAMLDAVINGNGTMAQFSHHEFGGSGQWMAGGMLMLGDMFNHGLKSRVDALCQELSTLVANQPGLLQTGSFQSQSQGSGHNDSYQQQGNWNPPSAQSGTGSSLFTPQADWWGPELRWPNSTGAQNGVRYAYFAQAHRLAIETGGHVTIYDTLDHQIGGVSQQQGSSGTLSFTSQYGTVNLSSLPVISGGGRQPDAWSPSSSPSSPAPMNSPAPAAASGTASESDIFATIEKLAGLRAKGFISDDEFNAKKAELLSRL